MGYKQHNVVYCHKVTVSPGKRRVERVKRRQLSGVEWQARAHSDVTVGSGDRTDLDILTR